MRRPARLLIVCVLLPSVLAAGAPGAVARPSASTTGFTYVVNSIADAPDADPADGVCAVASGRCTLRAAIMQANTVAVPTIVTVPAGLYVLNRPGIDDAAATGDLDISQSVTVQGAGSDKTIVDGNGAVTGDRVFQILPTAKQASLTGLTIRNGRALSMDVDFGQGGGVFIQTNASQIHLSDVLIESNQAIAGGGLAIDYLRFGGGSLTLDNVVIRANLANDGGGISALLSGQHSDTTLAHSRVYSNTATDVGGAVSLEGVFHSDVAWHIESSEIYSNVAVYGAGISDALTSSSVNFSVVRSNLHDNQAASFGGAILNDSSLIISQTTLADNSAGIGGGGLYSVDNANGLGDTFIAVDIEQSTLSANSAQTGGGIDYVTVNDDRLSRMTITNSTLSGNTASHDGAGLYASGGETHLFNATVANNRVAVPLHSGYSGLGGGVYLTATAVLTAGNTLLSGNTHRYGLDWPEADDCRGAIYSAGYNLIKTTRNCAINGSLVGNLTGLDPLLGPLQFNGGATQTMALLADSPAIDAAEVASQSCFDLFVGRPLITDQRGFARPFGRHCDIGAFEYYPPGPFLPVIQR